MADRTTVEDKSDKLTKRVEAIAEEVTGVDERAETLATKEQIIAPHGQVNAIEAQLRDTKRHKLVTRVADLEEKIFGASRD